MRRRARRGRVQLETSQEAAQADRLRALAARLSEPGSIPGVTVHQAKGGEWSNVGLRLNPDEAARRRSRGLDPQVEADRVVYVAATRAMDNAWLV
ncbi:3'-5' exonuclease [Iamia sp.]|uniref:3'-5' exonuclease n=1 Tax=Iamia sp. TaxID=2722710 RepID=UPI0039C8B5FD